MVRDGYLYGLAFGVVAGILWFSTHLVWLVLLPILLACFFLWFFRDPTRKIPSGLGEIVSPARRTGDRGGVDRDAQRQPASAQYFSERV